MKADCSAAQAKFCFAGTAPGLEDPGSAAPGQGGKDAGGGCGDGVRAEARVVDGLEERARVGSLSPGISSTLVSSSSLSPCPPSSDRPPPPLSPCTAHDDPPRFATTRQVAPSSSVAGLN
ncbi:hypothetical protein TRAPUB_6704 [Trametes pubescens]|uniref:Uncharacterized protein n=1 Tax=Trametes pubescens TaxID=154538 RepID=A0A1M2V523_TRAPU|nr:hypothetical protein TRAPUB_6704 [Trametes pubescens]